MPIYLDPLTGKTFAGFGRGNSPVINGFKNQGYYLDRLKDTVGSKFLKEDDTVLIIEFNAFDADYISGKRETDFYINNYNVANIGSQKGNDQRSIYQSFISKDEYRQIENGKFYAEFRNDFNENWKLQFSDFKATLPAFKHADQWTGGVLDIDTGEMSGDLGETGKDLTFRFWLSRDDIKKAYEQNFIEIMGYGRGFDSSINGLIFVEVNGKYAGYFTEGVNNKARPVLAAVQSDVLREGNNIVKIIHEANTFFSHNKWSWFWDLSGIKVQKPGAVTYDIHKNKIIGDFLFGKTGDIRIKNSQFYQEKLFNYAIQSVENNEPEKEVLKISVRIFDNDQFGKEKESAVYLFGKKISDLGDKNGHERSLWYHVPVTAEEFIDAHQTGRPMSLSVYSLYNAYYKLDLKDVRLASSAFYVMAAVYDFEDNKVHKNIGVYDENNLFTYELEVYFDGNQITIANNIDPLTLQAEIKWAGSGVVTLFVNGNKSGKYDINGSGNYAFQIDNSSLIEGINNIKIKNIPGMFSSGEENEDHYIYNDYAIPPAVENIKLDNPLDSKSILHGSNGDDVIDYSPGCYKDKEGKIYDTKSGNDVLKIEGPGNNVILDGANSSYIKFIMRESSGFGDNTIVFDNKHRSGPDFIWLDSDDTKLIHNTYISVEEKDMLLTFGDDNGSLRFKNIFEKGNGNPPLSSITLNGGVVVTPYDFIRLSLKKYSFDEIINTFSENIPEDSFFSQVFYNAVLASCLEKYDDGKVTSDNLDMAFFDNAVSAVDLDIADEEYYKEFKNRMENNNFTRDDVIHYLSLRFLSSSELGEEYDQLAKVAYWKAIEKLNNPIDEINKDFKFNIEEINNTVFISDKRDKFVKEGGILHDFVDFLPFDAEDKREEFRTIMEELVNNGQSSINGEDITLRYVSEAQLPDGVFGALVHSKSEEDKKQYIIAVCNGLDSAWYPPIFFEEFGALFHDLYQEEDASSDNGHMIALQYLDHLKNNSNKRHYMDLLPEAWRDASQEELMNQIIMASLYNDHRVFSTENGSTVSVETFGWWANVLVGAVVGSLAAVGAVALAPVLVPAIAASATAGAIFSAAGAGAIAGGTIGLAYSTKASHGMSKSLEESMDNYPKNESDGTIPYEKTGLNDPDHQEYGKKDGGKYNPIDDDKSKRIAKQKKKKEEEESEDEDGEEMEPLRGEDEFHDSDVEEEMIEREGDDDPDPNDDLGENEREVIFIPFHGHEEDREESIDYYVNRIMNFFSENQNMQAVNSQAFWSAISYVNSFFIDVMNGNRNENNLVAVDGDTNIGEFTVAGLDYLANTFLQENNMEILLPYVLMDNYLRSLLPDDYGVLEQATNIAFQRLYANAADVAIIDSVDYANQQATIRRFSGLNDTGFMQELLDADNWDNGNGQIYINGPMSRLFFPELGADYEGGFSEGWVTIDWNATYLPTFYHYHDEDYGQYETFSLLDIASYYPRLVGRMIDVLRVHSEEFNRRLDELLDAANLSGGGTSIAERLSHLNMNLDQHRNNAHLYDRFNPHETMFLTNFGMLSSSEIFEHGTYMHSLSSSVDDIIAVDDETPNNATIYIIHFLNYLNGGAIDDGGGDDESIDDGGGDNNDDDTDEDFYIFLGIDNDGIKYNEQLEGLRAFESNGDGWLSPEDKLWQDFFVFQDVNQNGESDTREKRSLDQAAIVAIYPTSDGVKRHSANGVTEYGRGQYLTKNDNEDIYEKTLADFGFNVWEIS